MISIQALIIVAATIFASAIIIGVVVAIKRDRREKETIKKIDMLSKGEYMTITTFESGNNVLDTLLRNANILAKIDKDNLEIIHIKINLSETEFSFRLDDLLYLIRDKK